MATPKRWTIAGLILLATCSLTIVDIVFDFRAHGREDSQIRDCTSPFSLSDVPTFFALMVVTKISMALMQLGLAIDCFITADMRLKGSNDHEFVFLVVCFGLYFLVSLLAVTFLIGTSTSTNCFSCCLAHTRVKVYLLWSIPSLLRMAATAVILLLALICGLYFVSKSFLNLLFRSFTYEAVSTSKDVEVV